MTRQTKTSRVGRHAVCDFGTPAAGRQMWHCDWCDTYLTADTPHQLHMDANTHIDNDAKARA